MIIGLLGMLVAVFPRATSLYDLTGEESLDGQLLGLVQWFNAAVRPQPKLATSAAIDHVDVSPFGMNVFVQGEPSVDVREELMQQLNVGGFKWIRQQFDWEDIEIHAKDDFIDRRNDPNGVDAWAKYDNIVDLAEQYDVNILARIDNPPSWSRAAGNDEGTLAPPDDLNDYGDFVAQVVERYAERITYFQLWNEPNGNGEWGAVGPNPEQFTDLLCEGYRRAKGANPNAIVVGPALTPTFDVSHLNLNDQIFMQRMYTAGAGDCFDLMSAQGYGLRSGPTDQRLQWNRVNFTYHLYIRDMMVVNGDADKAIWISETGWNALPDGMVPAGAEPYGKVSSAEQARYGVQLYERVVDEWPWIGVANYWFLKRPIPEPDQPYYYFRAMEPNFTPLPVWEALREFAPNADLERNVKGVWEFRPILFQLATLIFLITLTQTLMPNPKHDV